MNQLLTKIHQTPTAQRCPLAAEIFPILEAELAAIEQRSNEQGLKQDFPATNLQIDLLELATNELTLKLSGLDAPTCDLYLLSGLNKPEFLNLNEHLKKITAAYPETIATAKEVLDVRSNIATATALEIDQTLKKIPPIQEVLEALVALGPEKLKGILEFTKPTLLITPNNSFESKIAALNAHPKYENQTPAYVYTALDNPLRKVTSPIKSTITIVDGAPHPPHIPGIPSTSSWDERKKLFKKNFAAKGQRLINIHEYAVLMQLSLREYQKNGNDPTKIVDYYQGDLADTVTLLNDEYLTNSPLVACAHFLSYRRRAVFFAFDPEFGDDFARGRASVQLLQF